MNRSTAANIARQARSRSAAMRRASKDAAAKCSHEHTHTIEQPDPARGVTYVMQECDGCGSIVSSEAVTR